MKPNKIKKIVVYVHEDDYRALRARLVLTGQSFSGWIRKKMSQFLEYKIN